MALRDKKLPLEAKIYIVRALACRERPTEILAGLEEMFNVTVDRKALCHYDPRINAQLDADLKELYKTTAAEFWHKKNFEALNNLNYRQHLRMEIYEAAGRNLKLKLEIIEAAAKDEGGLFSNRRELTGAEGAPLVNLNVATASPEELAVLIAEFPLELISADTAAYMINKGWVSADRAGEADIELLEDGQWVDRARSRD